MILDTSAIIDILREDKKIIKKIEELQKDNIFSTTSISIFEIWQGIEDLKDERKKEKIHNLLESMITFDFSQKEAKESGKIKGILRNEGNIIDSEDCMIAGITRLNNEILLTKNTKHFNRINNLKIESY